MIEVFIGSDINLPNYDTKFRRGNRECKPWLIESGKGAWQNGIDLYH